MKTFLNFIWHFPCLGFVQAFLTAITGLLCCATIVGLPIGMGLLQFSLFLLWPFGYAMISKSELETLTGEKRNLVWRIFAMVVRIFYFPFGLMSAITMFFVAILRFCSILGIPCGIVTVKSLSTYFNPVNKVRVPQCVADEIERRKDEKVLSRYTSQNPSQQIQTPSPQLVSQVVVKVICPNCGEHVEETKSFCPDCGTAIRKKSIQIKEPEEVQDAPPVQPEADFSRYAPPHLRKEEQSLPKAEGVAPIIKEPEVELHNSSEKALTSTPSLAQEVVKEEKSGVNKVIIAIISVCLLLLIGGYIGYTNWYAPYKRDKDAPRFYTLTNTNFRSSKISGVEHNLLRMLPYGAELITYEKDAEWASVKYGEVEGYIAAPYILSKSDFALLNSIWGDADSRECIETAKCRLALLEYYKKRHIYGKPGAEMSNDYSYSETNWQVYTKAKDVKPNTVFYPRVSNKNSKYTDFAVIIKNTNTLTRKLLIFSFNDETEVPTLIYEEEAPVSGDIQKVWNQKDYYGNDNIKISYSY